MAKRKQVKQISLLQRKIIGIVVIFLCVVALFQLGSVGKWIDYQFQFIFGLGKYVVYILTIYSLLYFLWKEQRIQLNREKIAILLFIICALIMVTVFTVNDVGIKTITSYLNLYRQPLPQISGGLLFVSIFGMFSSFVGNIGVVIFATFLFVISVVLYFGKTIIEEKYQDAKHNIANYQEIKKEKNAEKMRFIPTFDLRKAKKRDSVFITLEEDKKAVAPVFDFGTQVLDTKEEKMVIPVVGKSQSDSLEVENKRVVPKKNEQYHLPELNLLKEGKHTANAINQKIARENSKKIIDVLAQFQVFAQISNISIGPTVTRFEIVPEQGVRISKIATLQHDIKMALAAKHLRIEAPIPGKSAVGIEVPNQEKEMVYMKEVMATIKNVKSKLLFVLGKNLTGNSVYGELNKMPHLLVAGSTGSGKSVCINSIITSILLRATPEEVRILLIDPKKVEFTPYKDIPHLVAPIITDANKAARALEVVVAEMDRRYDIFSEVGVKNISSYYELFKKSEDLEPLPYLMVVIDELADLMLVASKKVEASIQRITQLARAAGIHLIVATQRPSVDVITGIIKSNIPSRIAFAVSSSIDSRTILDESGAEKLLGNGDMLYIPIGEQNPIRVQGVYVSDEEVESICQHTLQYGKVEYMEVFSQLEQLDAYMDSGVAMSDDLYQDVKNFVISTKKASATSIQTRFQIGYPRAAKLMDMLERNGVIGPKNGGKPREILVDA